MKKLYLLLLLGLAGTLFVANTYADDDEWEDDDHYEYNYEYKDNDDKYEYVNSTTIPEAIRSYVQTKYNASIVKVERKSYGYEVKLSNGVELKFDNNWKLLYAENEYRYTQPVQTTTERQYKYITSSVKEKLDNIIQVKLFDKIKNLSTDKQIEILEKLNQKIDDLLAQIKSQASLTSKDELKIEILLYLKDKVNAYILEISDPTNDVINALFGN